MQLEPISSTSFDFWKPVEFSKELLEKKKLLVLLLMNIGKWADAYLSRSDQKIVLKSKETEPSVIELCDFDQSSSLWKTALKIVSCPIVIFIALPVKIIYKSYLNSNYASVFHPKAPEPKKNENPKIAPQKSNDNMESVTQSSDPLNTIIQSVMIGHTKLTLKYGDLTKEPANLIVNPANESLMALGGVCGSY